MFRMLKPGRRCHYLPVRRLKWLVLHMAFTNSAQNWCMDVSGNTAACYCNVLDLLNAVPVNAGWRFCASGICEDPAEHRAPPADARQDPATGRVYLYYEVQKTANESRPCRRPRCKRDYVKQGGHDHDKAAERDESALVALRAEHESNV